jgi:hypothetical protein
MSAHINEIGAFHSSLQSSFNRFLSDEIHKLVAHYLNGALQLCADHIPYNLRAVRIFLSSFRCHWTHPVKEDENFEALTALKIQVCVFWVVTPRSIVGGYPEDGGSMDLRDDGILPQHYMASQHRTTRLHMIFFLVFS